MTAYAHLRRAERTLGRPCRIAIDLAGPKLRTGPLEPGPAVVRIRPRRDVYGRVISPARVWLTAEVSPQPPPSPASACLQVPTTWLGRLRAGERVKFTDARNSKREFDVVDVTDHGCWVEATKTAYIVPGTLLCRHHDTGKSDQDEGSVGDLPSVPNAILLKQGDLLILSRDLKPGRPATRDGGGRIQTPALIGCTIPEVFEDVKAGDAIWLDDGKIGGDVEKVEDSRVLVLDHPGSLAGCKAARR